MLFDALVAGDCVICLQPLLEGPSDSAQSTPQKGARASVGNSGTATASATTATSPQQTASPSRHSVGASTFLPAGAVTHALASSSTQDGFHVGFAPGVPREYDANWLYTAAAAATSLLANFSGTGGDTRNSGDLAAPSSSSSSLSQQQQEQQQQQTRGLNEVTLLPCGHGFFHYGCILQLYEYSRGSTCPVCRAPIRSLDDLIPFRPRSRPAQMTGSVCAATRTNTNGDVAIEDTSASAPRRTDDAKASQAMRPPKRARSEPEKGTPTGVSVVDASASEDDDEASEGDADDVHDEDDITLVGSRQVDPSDAYCGLLERISQQYEARASKVHERGVNLRRSLKELEEDCQELQLTLAGCRRRKELLGDTSDGSRLRELRQTCAETRSASDSAARELASAIRENVDLQQQIDKFNRKSERFA